MSAKYNFPISFEVFVIKETGNRRASVVMLREHYIIFCGGEGDVGRTRICRQYVSYSFIHQ
jgi:hypothetical protein